MHVSVRTNLSVANNITSEVLVHVSASSKRQEWRNKIGRMKKRNKCQIVKLLMSTDLFLCRPKFIKYLDSEQR
jgi:hypothetical protein